MEAQGNPLVWPILIILFLAVGVHLVIYSNKRKKMLEKFAKKNNLKEVSKDNKSLEAQLNQRHAIKENGFLRTFMKIRDIIGDGDIFLFRGIELLDLNPYGNPETSHQNHIYISFDVPEEIDLFFIMDKNGKVSNLYPKDKVVEKDEYFKKIRPVIQNQIYKKSITISLRGGKALINTNPLVTGKETEEDLEYLLVCGRAIKSKLMS